MLDFIINLFKRDPLSEIRSFDQFDVKADIYNQKLLREKKKEELITKLYDLKLKELEKQLSK